MPRWNPKWHRRARACELHAGWKQRIVCGRRRDCSFSATKCALTNSILYNDTGGEFLNGKGIKNSGELFNAVASAENCDIEGGIATLTGMTNDGGNIAVAPLLRSLAPTTAA